MKKQHYSEHGQVLVIIVFAMFGLIGITGLAIDGSRAYSDRRQAQNAADTAALAAALAYVRTPDGPWMDVGYSRAASNGYDNNGTTNVVEVVWPPDDRAQSEYVGNTHYIQVVITSHLDTLFGRVVGINQVTNTVQAVVKVDPPVPTQLYRGNAVVGLAPHDCKAITWQGSAAAEVTGGGLFVNSDCSDTAFFNNSNAAKLKAPSLTVVGGADYNNNAIDIDTITENVQDQAMSYPPIEYQLPAPDCSEDATVDGETMTPGNWSGTFPPAHVKYLDSGFYCVNSGDFKLNAGDYLEGHNVLIYMATGKVTWNGDATVKLYAPETDPYKGLLLYLPVTNSSPVLINGNSGSEIEGTILAPASDITIKGTGDAGMTGQVIGYRVDISGNSGVKIHYDDTKVLWLWTNPNAGIMQ